MRLLFAPDSFKGTISSEGVCEIWASAAKECIPDVECTSLPVADGGEGLVNALLCSCGGELVSCTVKGPLDEYVQAEYALLSDHTAVIEMAAASGLPLVSADKRNPMMTSTYGTGQLIIDAVSKGCTNIILGLGGSATNDGGMGVGAALGIRYLDKEGNELPPCGRSTGQVAAIDLTGIPKDIYSVNFCIACDVTNPLCGINGASYIYGPQKGADPTMVKELDIGLQQLCKVTEALSEKPLGQLSGIGAAGGMALPLVAFFHAALKSGLDIVLDTIEFDRIVRENDIVITGEGCTDKQSAMGKVISGIGKRAKEAGKPVYVLSGTLEEGCETLLDLGITALFSTCSKAETLDWHLEHAKENLMFTSKQLFRSINSLLSEKNGVN